MPSPSWSWSALFAAGLLEAAWASAMKLSKGFTQPLSSVLTLLFMAGSVALLAFAMKRLPLGTAYAVWTGLGAVGAALAGIAFFGEAASPLRVGSLALIVLGIAGLKLAG
ncbi:MAG: multidrug efflux SMR transporter [Desulfovibrio sp.]|nr:multidrug efflux SMR transporter [Desulfovibrio sp.]